jgi:hypothetical protein
VIPVPGVTEVGNEVESETWPCHGAPGQYRSAGRRRRRHIYPSCPGRACARRSDAPGGGRRAPLRLSLEVDSHASDWLAFDATVVELSYEDPPTSAVRLVETGSVPFPATLEPGDTTTAVFVFAVPENQRSDTAITVSLRTGYPDGGGSPDKGTSSDRLDRRVMIFLYPCVGRRRDHG